MGVITTVRIICDYFECKRGQNGPAVIQWIDTEQQPVEANDFVLMNMGNKSVAFCSKLHASMFFVPPAYEVVMKKVIEFPVVGKEAT